MNRNKILSFLAVLTLALAFHGSMTVRASEPVAPSTQKDCLKTESTTRAANIKAIAQTYKAAIADAIKTNKAEKVAQNPDARKHYMAARKTAQKAKSTALAAENVRHRAATASCKPAKPAEVSTPTVTIQDFSFQPNALTVSAGTTVTWKQADSAPHQVVSDDGLFEGPSMQNGGTYTFTFDNPGTYAYHCKIHPSMKGTIIVAGGRG